MPETACAWESPRDRVGRADPKPFCEFGACSMAQLADATLPADSALYLTHIQRDDRPLRQTDQRMAPVPASTRIGERPTRERCLLTTLERNGSQPMPFLWALLEVAASQ